MPGHFVSFGTYAENHQCVHLSSFARGCYHEFCWCRAPMAFDLPMDTLTRRGGVQYMSHEEMVAIVERYAVHYHGRVYRNYQHGLDCYIKFAADAHIYKYQLIMPPISTAAGADPEDPYPSPIQYYLATGKVLEARYTPAEWAAMVSPGVAAGAMPSEDDSVDVDGDMIGTSGYGGDNGDNSMDPPTVWVR